MTRQPDAERRAEAERRERQANLFTIEVIFLGLVAVLVIFAFLEALTYKLVSSRTPFVIMAPLIVLIAIHALRLRRAGRDLAVRERIASAVRGEMPRFNAVLGVCGWMVVLVAMIAVLGHIAGLLLFCVIMMRFLARESWPLTLGVSLATTFFVWGVFEYAFNIELYRGLIVRYFLGFRDF